MSKVTHNRDMRTLDTKTNKMKGTWVVRIELEKKPLPEELLQCLFEEVSSTAEVVGENRNDLQHLFVIWCVSVKDPVE